MANNSANPDIVLNETANQRQEDMTDEENNIENDEGNQFGKKVVDSEKHCSVISPNNVLRVSYAEILKQPIRNPQSCDNSDSQVIAECDLTQGDQSYLETLQSLGDPFEHEVLCPGDRMTGSFVSDHVFNLSKKELSAKEISVLEKGLGFAPTPSHINEADLRRDLREFSRKMRCKWHFRNEVPQSKEEISQFKVKSQWNPPKGHPALEAFLNKTEKDIFSLIPEREMDYNLTRDEYLAMRS